MAREVTFAVPFDIPRTPRTKYQFRCYLASLVPQIGVFGKDGQDVGLGFVWNTVSGCGNGGLNTLSRRMQRALTTAGILSRFAEPYFLTQRTKFIRSGEPKAEFTLKEE